MMSFGDPSPAPWHVAACAAGCLSGPAPHHLDLWLDRWTRAQHMVMVGTLNPLPAAAVPRSMPRSTPGAGGDSAG